MKRCTKCKEEKQYTEYYKNKGSRDGYVFKCKACSKIKAHGNYSKTRDKQIAQATQWRKNNPEKARVARVKHDEKRKNDPEVKALYDEKFKEYLKGKGRLAHNIRCRFRRALKGKVKKTSTLLGLTGMPIWDDLKVYIESLWEPGMSWDNYSFTGWHIDHIKPLSSFDLTDPEQQALACHYTNLQPLWAKDNLSKGNRV